MMFGLPDEAMNDFKGLPVDEQRKVLSHFNSDFAGLPKGEQDKVLLSAGAKLSGPSEDHPISSYNGGDLTPEERFKAMNPDYKPVAPEWAAKYPNLYGVTGAAWETAKPLIELGAMGIGATPGIVTTPINPVLGPAAALAGGGAGYALAKQATRGIDKALGAPSDNTPAPLTSLAGGEKLPQTVQDILSGAEYMAEGEGISRGLSATGNIVKNKLQNAPSRIVNSLIKPLLPNFSYGKNPGRAVAQEGIIANNFDDLVSKITEKRQEIGQRLGNVADMLTKEAQTKNITADLTNTFTPIHEAITEAQKNPRTNAALITRLENLRDDLMKVQTTSTGQPYITRKLKTLTFNDGWELKRDIGDLTKFTGNPSDDKAVNTALKKVYGSIKETLNTVAEKVNPDIAPVYKKLNEKYADMTSAEIAAKYRDKIMERQNLVSLPGHIGAIGAGLTAFIQSGGQVLPSLLAGAGGAVLDKAIGSTAIKTRLASWLAKATPQEISVLEKKAPGFAAALQRAFPAYNAKKLSGGFSNRPTLESILGIRGSEYVGHKITEK